MLFNLSIGQRVPPVPLLLSTAVVPNSLHVYPQYHSLASFTARLSVVLLMLVAGEAASAPIHRCGVYIDARGELLTYQLAGTSPTLTRRSVRLLCRTVCQSVVIAVAVMPFHARVATDREGRGPRLCLERRLATSSPADRNAVPCVSVLVSLHRRTAAVQRPPCLPVCQLPNDKQPGIGQSIDFVVAILNAFLV